MIRVSSTICLLTDHLLARFNILTFVRHFSLVFTHIYRHTAVKTKRTYIEQHFSFIHKKKDFSREKKCEKTKNLYVCVYRDPSDVALIYTESSIDVISTYIRKRRRRKKRESEKNLYKWSFKKNKNNIEKVWKFGGSCCYLIYIREADCSYSHFHFFSLFIKMITLVISFDY